MMSRVLKLVLSLIVTVAACVLTFVWFDWKLFVVIFLWVWSNNMNQSKY